MPYRLIDKYQWFGGNVSSIFRVVILIRTLTLSEEAHFSSEMLVSSCKIKWCQTQIAP